MHWTKTSMLHACIFTYSWQTIEHWLVFQPQDSSRQESNGLDMLADVAILILRDSVCPSFAVFCLQFYPWTAMCDAVFRPGKCGLQALAFATSVRPSSNFILPFSGFPVLSQSTNSARTNLHSNTGGCNSTHTVLPSHMIQGTSMSGKSDWSFVCVLLMMSAVWFMIDEHRWMMILTA